MKLGRIELDFIFKIIPNRKVGLFDQRCHNRKVGGSFSIFVVFLSSSSDLLFLFKSESTMVAVVGRARLGVKLGKKTGTYDPILGDFLSK